MLNSPPLRPPAKQTVGTRLALHVAVSILLASVTASVATRAGAVLTTYTDRTTWQSAVGPLSGTEDFNSFAFDTSFQSTTITLNNMTVTGTTGVNGAATQKIDAALFEFGEVYVLDNTSYLIGDIEGSSQYVRFDFGNLVTAWGADFAGVSDVPRDTKIRVYDVSDILLGTVFMSSPMNSTRSFYGFELTSGLADHIILTDNTDGNDVFGIDDIGFVIPEPSTALLVGLGLAALGVRRQTPTTYTATHTAPHRRPHQAA